MPVATLIIDVQRDFVDPACDSPVSAPEKAFCIPGTKKLVEAAKKSAWRIVHVNTVYETPDSMPGLHGSQRDTPYCIAGTGGAEQILPGEADSIDVVKTRYSAFKETDLTEHLRDVDRLVVSGLAVDCCVSATLFDAEALDLECFVPFQAVSASEEAGYVEGLNAISKSTARIIDLETLVSGRELEDCLVEQSDVRKFARMWFRDQVSKLGEIGREQPLEKILGALDVP